VYHGACSNQICHQDQVKEIEAQKIAK
jgi:hypothetical protein